MPFYQVYHGVTLSDAQKDQIAGAITDAHAKQFHVLTEFVNISFLDSRNMSVYRGRKQKSGINIILANVRNGDSREHNDWKVVCDAIVATWAEAVPDSELDVCLVLGAIIAGVESGFPIPKAGEDVVFMKENFLKIQALADAGNLTAKEVIEEAKGRDDYQWLFV